VKVSETKHAVRRKREEREEVEEEVSVL